MKTLLENVNEIDELIHLLQKVEGKLRNGQFIDAWREVTRIIAYLSSVKQNVIKSAELKVEND